MTRAIVSASPPAASAARRPKRQCSTRASGDAPSGPSLTGRRSATRLAARPPCEPFGSAIPATLPATPGSSRRPFGSKWPESGNVVAPLSGPAGPQPKSWDGAPLSVRAKVVSPLALSSIVEDAGTASKVAGGVLSGQSGSGGKTACARPLASGVREPLICSTLTSGFGLNLPGIMPRRTPPELGRAIRTRPAADAVSVLPPRTVIFTGMPSCSAEGGGGSALPVPTGNVRRTRTRVCQGPGPYRRTSPAPRRCTTVACSGRWRSAGSASR